MAEDTKAVKEGAGEGAAPEPTELEKQLDAKNAEITRLTVEKENYKRGMLKAKGKPIEKEESELEEENIDERVTRLVKEQLLDSQIFKAQEEKDSLLKQALVRNKELETAIKNRSQISTADAGTGTGTVFTTKDTTLTDEKLAKFKAMGWDDKKIELYKKNLTKLR